MKRGQASVAGTMAQRRIQSTDESQDVQSRPYTATWSFKTRLACREQRSAQAISESNSTRPSRWLRRLRQRVATWLGLRQCLLDPPMANSGSSKTRFGEDFRTALAHSAVHFGNSHNRVCSSRPSRSRTSNEALNTAHEV